MMLAALFSFVLEVGVGWFTAVVVLMHIEEIFHRAAHDLHKEASQTADKFISPENRRRIFFLIAMATLMAGTFRVYYDQEKRIAQLQSRPPTLTLRQETGEDPRRELASLGTAWNEDNFIRAAVTGDDRTLDLFLRGGFHVRDHYFFMIIGEDSRLTAKVIDVLRKNRKAFDPNLCTQVRGNDMQTRSYAAMCKP